jgi:phosphoketolase
MNMVGTPKRAVARSSDTADSTALASNWNDGRISVNPAATIANVSGPGHGGPAVVGNTYLEGTYSEIYPNISQDEDGLRKLFVQFS